MAAINIRYLIFGCALLLAAATDVNAGGRYLRTKDGKTQVWNNAPAPGDMATWSGERDADGYASGSGTLTWYEGKPSIVTGTNIPSAKHSKLSRYTGTMVHGKLEGAVSAVDADGSAYHGTFVKGRRSDDWSAGAAPAVDEKPAKRVRKVAVATSTPSASARPNQDTPAPTPLPLVEKAVKEPPRRSDDSLQSLAMPPPSLRANVAPSELAESTAKSAPPSPAPRPHLKMEEVIQIADAEARAKGFGLGEYERLQATYTAPDDRWSVFYDQKAADGMAVTCKHFSVSVEDKTKKASIIHGR